MTAHLKQDEPDTANFLDTMKQGVLGKPVSRIEGLAKVTGTAPYAAEYPVENVAEGVLVTATIVRGKVVSIDKDAALAMPGVLARKTWEGGGLGLRKTAARLRVLSSAGMASAAPMAVMSSKVPTKMMPPMSSVQKRETHRSFSNSCELRGKTAQSLLAAFSLKMERCAA